MNYPQIKPTLNLDFSNTKTLDPRINFRRGTPGAYYDGKTYAKAEENLLSYSEDFSEWEHNENNIDITLYDAPDGSQTARKIIANSNSANHWMLRDEIISSGNIYTMSIYAKASGYDYLTIFESTRFTDDVTGWVTFNLSNGTIEYATDVVLYSITSTGNDWYRCSVTSIATSNGDGRFGVKPRPDIQGGMNPTFTGNNSSGILFWGAQLEQRDSVTAYTPTDGNPITKYQPQLMFASPDQPRFDHDVLTGESKGLLIEESRTNLIEYSDLSASTASTGVTINRNTMIAPAGLIDAFKVSAAAALSVEKYNLTTQGKTYTMSIYAKTAERSSFKFLSNVSGLWQSVIFDLDAISFSKESGFSDASIIDVGNGWRRCSATFTDSVSQSKVYRFIEFTGGSSTDGMYFWGAQLEEGSFPTSYIKTSGASATRSADNASITGENFSSWYRQDEGSFEVDFKSNLPINKWVYIFSLTQNGDYTVNNLALRHPINEETVACRFLVNGSAQFEAGKIDQSYDHLGFSKAVIAYNNQDISVGTKSEFLTQATSIGPNNLNQINLFDINSTSGSNYSNCGHIKKLSYYPQRLTNEQLQQLTK
jgi:hypothetical protein